MNTLTEYRLLNIDIVDCIILIRTIINPIPNYGY